MRTALSLLLFSLLITDSFPQILRGDIKDSEGNPIPFATVYIKELQQGTTANVDGEYEIRLPSGKYTVTYQSLGFEPEFRDITIKASQVVMNVVLKIQFYEIPEVRITSTGEDPAYGIMRKVIGLAPYYLNHVEYYKAEVYLKGNLLIKRIPKILQRTMRVEARDAETGSTTSSDNMKEGDSYMMESFNEVEFRAPDRYIQRVISSRSTFPDQGGNVSPMDFIQASFYQPVMIDMFISPLSPDAFFHYKFRFLGLTTQEGYAIDKIEVIPRRKSQQLFKGTIYIIEDLWCLQSVDLENDNIAGKLRIQQLYRPVQEDTWMPVSYKFAIDIAIIGVKADAGYGSSIRYMEVRVNQSLAKPVASTDYSSTLLRPKTSAPDTTKTKTAAQIEKILSKEELTNRDMAKLSGLLQKQTKESLPDSVKNTLEVADRTTYIIEKDAGRKDSAYWSGIRPIPLSDIEARSVRRDDSLKAALTLRTTLQDTTGAVSAKMKRGFFRTVRDITGGHTWSDTLGFSFTWGGIIDPGKLSFNTVDGFVYGVDLRLSKTWNRESTLSIFPDFRYAFSRQSLMWRVNGFYRFNRIRQDQMYFRLGMASRDISNAGSINTFLNSLSTLLMERNYLKLYDSRYLTLGYRGEISNGINLDVSAGYEDRRILENTTSFSIINTQRDYSSNRPVNSYLDIITDPLHDLRDHRHGYFAASVRWTPRQKYTLRDNTKIIRGSDWPTFSFTWKHGINKFTEAGGTVKNFDLLRVEASKSRELGAFSEFRWRYRAGTFIRNSGFTFIDFHHFNPQPLPVLLDSYQDAFMLPAYYSLSTPGLFSELHVKYTTPYLLLKLLPVLSKTLMRENLSLSFLWSRYHEAYTEIGYTISQFLLFGEAGIYAGFDNLKYNSIGGKIILSFN